MSKLPLPSHVQTKYLAADKKLDPAQIAAVQARAVKYKLDDPMAPGRLAQIANTFEPSTPLHVIQASVWFIENICEAREAGEAKENERLHGAPLPEALSNSDREKIALVMLRSAESLRRTEDPESYGWQPLSPAEWDVIEPFFKPEHKGRQPTFDRKHAVEFMLAFSSGYASYTGNLKSSAMQRFVLRRAKTGHFQHASNAVTRALDDGVWTREHWACWQLLRCRMERSLSISARGHFPNRSTSGLSEDVPATVIKKRTREEAEKALTVRAKQKFQNTRGGRQKQERELGLAD